MESAGGKPGLPVALTAALVFLLPLALGIVGAGAVHRWVVAPAPLDGVWQFCGMATGFAVGVLLARGALWGLCQWRARRGRG